MTLDEAVEEFLIAMVADGLAHATVHWYASLLRGFAKEIPAIIEEERTGKKARLLMKGEGFRGPVPKPFNAGDVETIVSKCPRCGATDRQIKIGKNASGSQRLKCQHCKTKYTPRG